MHLTQPEEVQEEEEEEDEHDQYALYESFFAVHSESPNSGHYGPLLQPVTILGQQVTMQVDTGSPTTLIPEKTWSSLGAPELRPTPLKLRTYTGDQVRILGTFSAQVSINGATAILPLIVTEGEKGVPLMGRDWLYRCGLDWKRLLHVTDGLPLPSRLQDFKQLFADGMGTISSTQVRLTLKPGAVPKFCRYRQVPYALEDKVKAELNRLESVGVLKKVLHSDWASPLVVVDKPGGGIRLCCDYKATLNPQLQVNQYPLPRPEDLFATMQGGKAKFFTKLDFAQAYLQLPLEEESRKLTTISTIQGLYEFTRLPFGVASAPALFQKFIEDLLGHLSFVKSYLDDVLVVGGETEEEHWALVIQVLKRLQASGIRLQLSKCMFAKKEVEHLGYVLSSEGIKTSPKKVAAVMKSPTPTNVTELRAFLGLVTFYAKFVPALSSLAYPLYQLLKKEVSWHWGGEEQRSWMSIKSALTSAPILCHYNPELPLLLSCDASSFGLAAVLSHRMPDGSERPIAYTSRTLSQAEKGYSQLHKEGAAIMLGVTRFHSYIYGRSFILITDHKPLLGILGPYTGIPSLAAARLQRWAIKLSAYQYELQYRRTEDHGNADALSRLPLPEKGPVWEYDSCYSMEFLQSTTVTFADVQRATRSDSVLAAVMDRLRKGWKDADFSTELAPFAKRRLELSIEQDTLL